MFNTVNVNTASPSSGFMTTPKASKNIFANAKAGNSVFSKPSTPFTLPKSTSKAQKLGNSTAKKVNSKKT